MPRLGTTLPALTLLAACADPVAIPGTDLPQLTVPDTRVDFGNVEWGETAIDSLNGKMPNNLGQDLDQGVFSPEDIRKIYPEPYQAPPAIRDE